MASSHQRSVGVGRRAFLRGVGGVAAVGALRGRLLAESASKPLFRARREVFIASPQAGVTVLAASYYTRADVPELVSRHHTMTRSDTADRAFLRTSADNGRTWSEPREVMTVETRDGATYRRGSASHLVDPRTGWLLQFRIEGLFREDTPLARLRNWTITCAGSKDGGRTTIFDGPVIHRGAEFSAEHPLPGVWRGKNCAYIGDISSVPMVLADGTILVPIQIAPLGAEGKLHNPGGGYTWTQAAVLIGRWNKAERLEWEMSAPVEADPALSSRGMIEPTLAQLTDGRLMMVMRGSNEKRPQARGAKWISFSSDGGRKWTTPAYWNYGDGSSFYSPSACSQLLRHSSGRLFWLGNITPANPDGNRPRYPFVIGEVDVKTGLLRKEAVQAIDDRGPGDSELLALSNFYAREDRETRDIVVHMSRQGTKANSGKALFGGDAFLYRLSLL